MKNCIYPNCSNLRSPYLSGLCSGHRMQQRRGIALRPIKPAYADACTEPDCNKNHFSRGLCKSHYRKIHLTGIGRCILATAKDSKCKVPDCIYQSRLKGFCPSHYHALNLGKIAEEDERKCEYPGCNLKHHCKSLCYPHYMAYKATQKSEYLLSL